MNSYCIVWKSIPEWYSWKLRYIHRPILFKFQPMSSHVRGYYWSKVSSIISIHVYQWINIPTITKINFNCWFQYWIFDRKLPLVFSHWICVLILWSSISGIFDSFYNSRICLWKIYCVIFWIKLWSYARSCNRITLLLFRFIGINIYGSSLVCSDRRP